MAKKENAVASVVAADAEVVEETQQTAVAVREETAPAASGLGNFGCEGGPMVLDWTWVHLKFEMSKKRPDGNQGEFYLGREWEVKLCDKGGALQAGVLPKPNQRFTFVIVGRKDGYKHYLTQAEFNAGKTAARFFADPAQGAKGWALARKAALDAGETIGSDAWRDGDPSKGEPARVGPTASEFMQLMILVEKPEGCEGGDELFSIPLDGRFYAPAIMEFDKMNWKKAYTTVQTVINGELNKKRVNKDYKPCIFNKVFWGYSAAVERQGRNGAPAKVVTTPVMARAVVDGKGLELSEAAVTDLQAIVSGAAESAVSDDAF